MGKSSTPNSFFLPFFSSTPYNCHRLPGQNNYTEFFKTPYTLQKTSINMKFFSQLLVLGLAAEATVASSWFSKSVYNKWHETELERWLSDHNVPYPTPYDRAQLETAVKDNWLYQSWSESDLKEWLDLHGIPAPQPTTRDKLIASVRRNARIASLKAADMQASASKSAAAAAETLSDKLLDSWSDSQIKEWADKNGIKVPQGSRRNELLAIARKHRAQLTGDNVSYSAKSAASKASDSGASAFGAATSRAGNEYANATDDAALKADDLFQKATSTWSESRLKAYLDARGVPVPQSGKKDELLAAVRLNRHKAATGWSAWTFDTWTTENLKKYLASSGNKAAEKASKKADASREQLLSAAQVAYSSASKTGGVGYASVTSYLAKQTDAAKDSMFDTWSESELKNYLDSYGFDVPQGSTKNQLVTYARNSRNYFQ